jgi:hypothetical protein
MRLCINEAPCISPFLPKERAAPKIIRDAPADNSGLEEGFVMAYHSDGGDEEEDEEEEGSSKGTEGGMEAVASV